MSHLLSSHRTELLYLALQFKEDWQHQRKMMQSSWNYWLQMELNGRWAIYFGSNRNSFQRSEVRNQHKKSLELRHWFHRNDSVIKVLTIAFSNWPICLQEQWELFFTQQIQRKYLPTDCCQTHRILFFFLLLMGQNFTGAELTSTRGAFLWAYWILINVILVHII